MLDWVFNIDWGDVSVVYLEVCVLYIVLEVCKWVRNILLNWIICEY